MALPKTVQSLKILDFSRVLAAPLTSMILSDLGAQVWKIEKPGTGDDTRKWIPPTVHGQSCYFLCANRNKKSLAIDLAKPEGLNIAKKLASKCDVLLENFKTGNMERFGLSYDQLRKDNKKIIYCSVTGYGSTGPYASTPGYDVITEAVGGFMKATGPPSGPPCKAAVAVTDIMTGLYAHGAILAAVLHRNATGEGQKIECNLLSTQLAAMVNLASNYLNAGLEAKPLGTAHESIVPYEAFETSDGRHYVIGAGNDAAFRELCRVLEAPELAEDPEFQTNILRVKNRDRLLSDLRARFLSQPLDYWSKALANAAFPHGPVNSLAEAFAHPQVAALRTVQSVTHPSYGTVQVVGPAVKYSSMENTVRAAPPLLGEHTREILGSELGFSNEKLLILKDQKIIDFPDGI